MKVLMVTPFYYPIIGGTETYVETMSIKLNEIGVSTDILTFSIDKTWKPWSINQIRGGSTEDINGMKIIRIPAITFLPTRIMFRMNFLPGKFTNYLKEYDVIHFHNDIDLSFPIFSSHIDKPKIFHCHLINNTSKLYRRNPIYKYIFKNITDRYIIPSKFSIRLLTDIGIREDQIEVVPNGVNIDKFKPLNKPKTENLLLFVGRLHPQKGLLTILESLQHLHTSIQLKIIGPSLDSIFIRKIIEKVQLINKKTNHKVDYLGAKTGEELVKWYQKASLLVQPSLSELFPMVTLEAMSCGTPVVATNIGGIPEIVADYKTGILVPPNDAVKLAEAIQFLLDNEKIRIKFGEECRKRVVENFSSEAVAKELFKIYKKMI
jgi:glycosyltransferase involved in cell wall biosynthesis